MKKIIGTILCASLLLSVAGCKKKDAAKTAGTTEAAKPAGPVHPMTYTLDLGDVGSFTFSDNSEYGTPGESTRQALVNFSDAIKYNKPEAGDKIRVTGKLTFASGIDSLKFGLTDDSADAGYWMNLNDDHDNLLDIKAGQTVNFDETFDITVNVVKNVKVFFAYGEQNGAPMSVNAEKVADTYVGEIDPSLGPRTEAKVWEMDISKNAAFVEIKPEYPWINGTQDTTAAPQHYQGLIHIGHLFGGDLPMVGDTINLTWKFQSNCDISELYARCVENTGAVAGWWAEIDENAGNNEDSGKTGQLIATDIKAGEPKVATMSFHLTQDPIEGLSLCVVYPLSACDGGSIFKYAK